MVLAIRMVCPDLAAHCRCYVAGEGVPSKDEIKTIMCKLGGGWVPPDLSLLSHPPPASFLLSHRTILPSHTTTKRRAAGGRLAC